MGLTYVVRQASQLQRWVDSADGARASLARVESLLIKLQAAEEVVSAVRSAVEGDSQKENRCANLLRQVDKTHALEEAHRLSSRTINVTLLVSNILASISHAASASIKQLRPPATAALGRLGAETEASVRAAQHELSHALGSVDLGGPYQAPPPAAPARLVAPGVAASDGETPRQPLRNEERGAQPGQLERATTPVPPAVESAHRQGRRAAPSRPPLGLASLPQRPCPPDPSSPRKPADSSARTEPEHGHRRIDRHVPRRPSRPHQLRELGSIGAPPSVDTDDDGPCRPRRLSFGVGSSRASSLGSLSISRPISAERRPLTAAPSQLAPGASRQLRLEALCDQPVPPLLAGAGGAPSVPL